MRRVCAGAAGHPKAFCSHRSNGRQGSASSPHLRTSRPVSVHRRDCDAQPGSGPEAPGRVCVFRWYRSGLVSSSGSICGVMPPRTQLAFLVTRGWAGQPFPSHVPAVCLGGQVTTTSLIVALERTADEKVLCVGRC